MSAIETDLNPDAFVGLSFPLKVGSNYDFQMTKTVVEQSVHNLRNLLLTYPGERVAQPTFGSRLRELLFEPINEDLEVRVEEEIRRAIVAKRFMRMSSKVGLVVRIRRPVLSSSTTTQGRPVSKVSKAGRLFCRQALCPAFKI